MEDKTLTYTLIFPTLPVTPSPRHPVTGVSLFHQLFKLLLLFLWITSP
ncbi:hypothetical protein CWATWH8502_329 [Crocosphaera watsonii WH 8502]|uniref:Uncharacterized protein n=1 Tax=Crocosphaera watsonii WH 8502 TaxID=423474 RepID=T2IAF2_CROWT|nr:hypothetical protein CWATWH8502_329 [Crocosphaera watsonii WH 8502]